MKFSVGFSDRPYDTFIFDAMTHQKVDTEGLEFDVVVTGTEQLNRQAFNHSFDIVKLSFNAFAFIADVYKLITSGSTMSPENGPLLVGKKKIHPNEVYDLTVAIPGKYDASSLLLNIEFAQVKEIREYHYFEIAEAVLEGEVDAGIILDEQNFTYENKGLKKIIDLGGNWEEKNRLPVPLKGIAVSRNIDDQTQKKIERVVKRSIEFAKENPDSAAEFIKKHARGLTNESMQKLIDWHVNDFTTDFGEDGKKAIQKLYEQATLRKLVPSVPDDLFVV